MERLFTKVVAFNGSPRKEGNTYILLRAVLSELQKEDVETEIVHPKDPLRGCIACSKCFDKKNQRCSFDEDMINGCIEKMIASDGVLLGSPTYFSDLTPELKALIDRAGFVGQSMVICSNEK